MQISFILIGIVVVVLVINVESNHQWKQSEETDEIETERRDSYGCDAAIASCGKNGGCCDQHDACYKKHRCTYHSWLYAAVPPLCLLSKCCQCNIKVMACAVLHNPGKSSCCADNTCGQERLKKLLSLTDH